jgi:hypothetical protein
MPGFDGTGPSGMGPMTGGGRGFCAVPLPAAWPTYMGTGAYRSYSLPWGTPFAPTMSREQEIGFLKDEAWALKRTLEEIDARIKELAGERA